MFKWLSTNLQVSLVKWLTCWIPSKPTMELSTFWAMKMCGRDWRWENKLIKPRPFSIDLSECFNNSINIPQHNMHSHVIFTWKICKSNEGKWNIIVSMYFWVHLVRKELGLFFFHRTGCVEYWRLALQSYSNWPTYPQLYLDGELLGGLDVVREELQDEDFVSKLPKAAWMAE